MCIPGGKDSTSLYLAMSQALVAPALPCMLASRRSCFLRGLGLHHPSLTPNTNAQQQQQQLTNLTPTSPICSLPPPQDDASRIERDKAATRALISAIAAGILIMNFTGDAMAAQSGGRVGGQAFRSRPAPPPRSAPAPRSAPRINSPRTNIFINPPFVAPPLYGNPFFGGWSPFSFYVPGPSLSVGIGGGFEFFGILLVLGVIGSIINRVRRREDDDYYD